MVSRDRYSKTHVKHKDLIYCVLPSIIFSGSGTFKVVKIVMSQDVYYRPMSWVPYMSFNVIVSLSPNYSILLLPTVGVGRRYTIAPRDFYDLKILKSQVGTGNVRN